MTHYSVDILANIGAIFYRVAYSFIIAYKVLRVAYSFIIAYKVLRERYYDDF